MSDAKTSESLSALRDRRDALRESARIWLNAAERDQAAADDAFRRAKQAAAAADEIAADIARFFPGAEVE